MGLFLTSGRPTCMGPFPFFELVEVTEGVDASKKDLEVGEPKVDLLDCQLESPKCNHLDGGTANSRGVSDEVNVSGRMDVCSNYAGRLHGTCFDSKHRLQHPFVAYTRLLLAGTNLLEIYYNITMERGIRIGEIHMYQVLHLHHACNTSLIVWPKICLMDIAILPMSSTEGKQALAKRDVPHELSSCTTLLSRWIRHPFLEAKRGPRIGMKPREFQDDPQPWRSFQTMKESPGF
ncbi:hypothetical protein VNO77_22691 [Canavalia gladiata]|uniref:Uncharacterized protein n=1 Tax=Canavalia gladiata TaxID=3824 RepID=A0AAN9QB80_CANGL